MNKKSIKFFYFLVSALIVSITAQTAFALGRIPKKQHEEALNALKQCAEENESLELKLESEMTRLEAKVNQLEENNSQLLKDMESSKNSLTKNIAKLRKEKQDLEAQKANEVHKLKSTYDAMVKDMKSEIEQGSIQITQLQDKLSLKLIDKILFNSGQSEVNVKGKKVLDKVAKILKTVKDKQIRIEGHTDNVPIGGVLKEKYPTNWELSTARATSVARYLQDAGGINPKLLSAAGYGEYRPIADNKSKKGKSQNRRIEIALVPLETASVTPVKKQ